MNHRNRRQYPHVWCVQAMGGRVIGGKRYIVKLNERVAIITEDNISRLSYLYVEIDIDDLFTGGWFICSLQI